MVCQNYTEKFNDLQQRYEYFGSDGRMVGYKKYNSLSEQWEYTDLTSSNNSQSGRYNVHDYGEPQSTFNKDLMLQALSYKQARYDNLTIEQKTAIYEAQKYSNQRDWVAKNSYVWNQHSEKLAKKLLKSLKKESNDLKKYSNKSKVDISTLANGWYEVIIHSKLFQSNDEKFYQKRYIYVEEGKPHSYLGANNILFQIDNTVSTEKLVYTNLITNRYSLGYVDFFLINKNRLETVPEYFYGTKVYFYLTDKVDGKVYVDILNEQKDRIYYLPNIDKYFSSAPPNCETKEGIAFITLPPGKYEFFARSESQMWRNIIEINDNGCRSVHLEL
jgi:hypothetical protein